MRELGMKADRGRSYAEIERESSALRARLAPGVAPHERLDMLKVLDRLEDVPARCRAGDITVHYTVGSLPDGCEGMTAFDAGMRAIVITLDCATYEDLLRGYCRPPFTAAHEVSHAYMHTNELVRMRLLPHLSMKRDTGHEIYFDTEWHADAGAGALLCPAAGIAALVREGRFDVPLAEVVAARYGVSQACAEVRIRTFHKLRGQGVTVR